MPFTLAPPSSPSSGPGLQTAPVVRRLPNGLTIIAEQVPIDAVNLSIWLPVGSSVESDAINGMAHFLEHMIFKGTPQIRCGEFEQLIEERGAVTNAATSQDYTHYYITTAPQDFAQLAPLQIDLVVNASLPDEAFERERPVILEEIRRSEDNPRRRTFYRSMEMSFDRLPYRRPVLGPTEVIEQLSADQMRTFHRNWYQPSRMTAVAVGNLPVETLIKTVERSFEKALSDRGTVEVPELESLGQVPGGLPEDAFQQIKRVDYTDDSLQQSRLIMGWRVPGMADLSETYALDVAASILGQGRTTRLVQELRENRKLVNSISVSNMTFRQQGVFYISAYLAAEHIPEVEATIAAHIQQLHDQPITADELRRIRTQVANRYVFGSESPSDRAGLYGYYHTLTGDISNALTYPEAIRSVEPAQVQAAVRQYLPVDAYRMVTLRPSEGQHLAEDK
ncbi:MAG: pitrilysin family protein [Cyanobacteria bacterium P01_D01_bin.44]